MTTEGKNNIKERAYKHKKFVYTFENFMQVWSGQIAEILVDEASLMNPDDILCLT